MIRDALRVSPQQADPLSWLARSEIPFYFAAAVAVYGVATTLVNWTIAPRPWLDLVAVALMVAACLWVQRATGPLRPRFRPARASVAIVVSLAAVSLSAYAAVGSAVPVTFWWAPVGVAMVIATFAAYVTPIESMIYGALFSTATIAAAWVPYVGRNDPWSSLSTVVIAAYPVLTGVVATVVFCIIIVARSQQLLAGERARVDPDAHQQDVAAQNAEVTTLARLGSRVAPFLATIAETGEVTEADRALAGQLARRLRAELVSQANTSWLESLATNGRIFVVDTEHRADSLTAAQRTVLRGLILTAAKDPSIAEGSLFIELRGHPDGSTAVALSLDIHLPEGRRMMMVAPYYLALRSTATDVSWDQARERLQFTVPPRDKSKRNFRNYLPE
jgi:hypothetical protein